MNIAPIAGAPAYPFKVVLRAEQASRGHERRVVDPVYQVNRVKVNSPVQICPGEFTFTRLTW
jgi:hypothetical protein